MVEPSDALINADRPVVQDADEPDHVDIYFPSLDETVQMHHEVFLATFGEGMRIITETDPEVIRDGPA